MARAKPFKGLVETESGNFEIREQVEIPKVEVFWNTGDLISICQHADSSGYSEEKYIVLDLARARALRDALSRLIAAEEEGA